MSCVRCLRLISLKSKNHLQDVCPIISQFPPLWTRSSKQQFWCFPPRAMGLLDQVQMKVFDVFSRPNTDDRITSSRPSILTKHKLSSIAKPIKRTTHKLEDLRQNNWILDLLFLHGGCISMSCKVIFRRTRQKGNKDACMIRRVRANHHVHVSKTRIYRPFLLLAGMVCKICLVKTAKYGDNRSSNWPL